MNNEQLINLVESTTELVELKDRLMASYEH